MFRLCLVTVWVLFTSTVAIAQTGFTQVMQDYEAQQYDKARDGFEALAAIGQGGAIFNLGVMYLKGQGVDKDISKAYAFFRIAAEGFPNQAYKDTYLKVSNVMPEESMLLAMEKYTQLKAKYAPDVIIGKIMPKPLLDEDCEQQIDPINTAAPIYPKVSASKGEMGVTLLNYTVSPEGYIRDIRVDNSSSEAFSKASIDAAKKFIYPPMENASYGFRLVFTFLIESRGGVKVNEKRLKSTIDEYKEAAETSDPIAEYRYGQYLSAMRHFKDYLKKVDLQHKTSNEWLLKSAKQGLPHAQYELGWRMYQGQGCEVNKEAGQSWLKASAAGGYSPAQVAIANIIDEQSGSAEAIRTWLESAALVDNSTAKVALAWELVSQVDHESNQPNRALELVSTKLENYYDEVRVEETYAAAYARLNNFSKAVKHQRKALKKAKRLKYDIPVMTQRLTLYENNQYYSGDYYASDG